MTADAEVETNLRDYWRKEYDWIDISKVDAVYDDKTGEEHLSMDGLAKMEWKSGTSTLGRRYETDGAGLGWKADYTRDPGPDLDAPFTVKFPYFSKTTETMVLPDGGSGFTIEGDMVDKTVAGREMERRRSVRSGRVLDGGQHTGGNSRVSCRRCACRPNGTAQRLSRQTIYLRAPRLLQKDGSGNRGLPAHGNDRRTRFFEGARSSSICETIANDAMQSRTMVAPSN